MSKTFWVKEADQALINAGVEFNFQIRGTNKLHTIELLPVKSGGTFATRAQMIAEIDSIQVRRGDGNKDIIFDRTPGEIIDMDYNFYYAKDGSITNLEVLPIMFDIPCQPTDALNKATGIGMAAMQYVSVTVKFKDPTTTLANGTLKVRTEWEKSAQGAGTILVRRRATRYFGGTGLQTLTDLFNQQSNVAVRALHIAHTGSTGTGAVTSVSALKNDEELFRDLLSNQNLARLRKAGRTPQTGYTSIDFAQGNEPTDFVSLADLIKFHLEVTWSAQPDNFVILTEELHGTV